MNDIKDILSMCMACTGICIDSRKVKKGEFFVALKGPEVDGNAFAQDALSNGAKFALIDNEVYKTSDKCILVDDALDTLQTMGSEHRKSLTNTTVIAIAGSNGKTTTKELLYNVLSQKYSCYRTIGNLNNHIGVPINILNLNANHQIAIIEIGANHKGEHTKLCQISQPNYGIVTNCGKDHLEGYGSEADVIHSNKELYDYLLSVGAQAFVNANDQTLCSISEGVERIFYAVDASKNDHILSARIKQQFPHLELEIHSNNKTWRVTSKLYGEFQLANISAAVAVGLFFNVDIMNIKLGIESYEPSSNRSQIIEWCGNTVFLDAYNANPTSVMEMIHFFDKYPSKYKLLILGSMAELGDYSNQEHLAIVNELKTLDCNQIILVGEEFKGFLSEIPCVFFENTNDLLVFIKKQSFSNYAILVKGSRKHRLESLFTT